MEKNMKKITLKSAFALLIVLCTLLTLIPALVSCETTDFELVLSSDGKSYEVTGYNGGDKIVKIPEKYKGLPVSAIAPKAFEGMNIEKVVIPGSVKTVGTSAFANCKSLAVCEIKAGVEKINPTAFQGCEKLTEIIFPKGLKSIGSGAFLDCIRLYKISLPASLTGISGSSFWGCKSLSTITLDSGGSLFNISGGCITNDAGELIVGCLGSNLSNDINAIAPSAFAGRNISEIVIPKTVLKINQFAFAECSMLRKVYYLGSESDWSDVEVEESNLPVMKDKLYFYSESAPQAVGNFWHYVNGLPVIWQ